MAPLGMPSMRTVRQERGHLSTQIQGFGPLRKADQFLFFLFIASSESTSRGQ